MSHNRKSARHTSSDFLRASSTNTKTEEIKDGKAKDNSTDRSFIVSKQYVLQSAEVQAGEYNFCCVISKTFACTLRLRV